MLQKILFFWKIYKIIKKKQENSINKKENGVASNQIL